MNNYEYVVYFCKDHSDLQKPAGRFLDYGCGAGEAVQLGLKEKLDFYGCDVFFEGGDYSQSVPTPLLEQGRVKRMEGGLIPFPGGFFDIVVNNQVMEHVKDLDAVLKEIARIVKPGGKVLSIFPDKSIWREGHSGIPFLHWFPTRSRLRRIYACCLRAIGFGKFSREGKSSWQWAGQLCDYLDNWTIYRPEREIQETYLKYFSTLEHQELDWFNRRVENKRLLRLLPNFLKLFITRKWGCMVLVAQR